MISTDCALANGAPTWPPASGSRATRGFTAALLLGLVSLSSITQAQESGELVVKSKPSGAAIKIDGQPAGKAPLTRSGLPAGRHSVLAIWPDGSKATGRGRVVAGGSVTLWMKVPVIGATAEAAPSADGSTASSSVAAEAAGSSAGRTEAMPPDAMAPGAAEATGAPGSGSAEQLPPSTVEAPPAPPASKLTIVQKPIASPLHPRLRMTPAMTLGLGVYCPNFGGSSRSQPWGRWCAAQLHVGWDGRFGDFHIVGLLGEVLRGGVKVGFELGTRYFQLGPRRSRAALAVRGNFDLLIAKLGEPVPGRADDGLLAFSNTYGPHLSIALNPRTSLEIRAAVGWTVGGFFAHHEGFDRPTYGLVCEGWLGMRFAP